MNKSYRYLAYGFAIGLGATAGCFGWFFVYAQRAQFLPWFYSGLVDSGDSFATSAAILVTLSSLIGLIIGLQAERRARKLAAQAAVSLDPKTGLYLPSRLQEELAHAFEIAKRYDTPLTCILFDIDDYQKLNDDHGHSVGDAVLSAISDKVKLLSRRVDSAGRLNGVEFLLIMPQTSTLSGRVVAERLRNAASNLKMSHNGKSFRVTLSAGVAMFPTEKIQSKSSLLRAAAQALYKAKDTGKNKTVVSGELEELVR